MTQKDPTVYRILVIEDNPGDYLLVEDYLDETILAPKLFQAKTFRDATRMLKDPEAEFDIILLDLSLPDTDRDDLINEMRQYTKSIPTIVLTGYSDLSFAIRSLSQGISDYLIKENITATILYKSILYNIERFKFVKTIQDSEKLYSDLFHLSPIPMWVHDKETFDILDVNEAAIAQYGYSGEEFLSMKVTEIQLPEIQLESEKHAETNVAFKEHEARHVKKNGERIYVETRSNMIHFKGRPSEIVLANNITQRITHIQTIESQNEKLREIAWMQSHVVRAPLARIMGLIDLMSDEDITSSERGEYLQYVNESAHELDGIIKSVVDKSQQINLKK